MKIAIFTDTFPPQVNGVSYVARDSAAAFATLGHDVMVFTVGGENREEKTATGAAYRVKKLPSVSLPEFVYHGDQYAFVFPPGIGTLRALKEFKPDIIHSHTPFFAGWGAVMGKKWCGVPLVGTHHTFYDDYLKHVKMDYSWGKKLTWKYTVAYYNRAEIVTTPSRALGEGLVKHGLKSPLHILPNPANTVFFAPAATAATKQRLKKRYRAGKYAVVYMGRISYEKDIDQAIKAFAFALRDLPGATFMIVGDGPERKRLEHLTEKLGISESVIFTGMLHREDLRDALWANDLFLTASRSENMPVSIIEAMACGLPVAAVRAKGIPEIVKHGKNGLLTEPDRPDLLARTIVRLFSPSGDRSGKGVASRKLAEQYSKEQFAARTVALYEKIITAKKS